MSESSNTGLGSILGDITYLMMRARSHRYMFVADLEWLVMPALALKQMRVFRDKRKPLAYFSWAYVNKEVETRLLNGQGRLAPKDWKSGNRAWIIDAIVPGKKTLAFYHELNEQAFKGKEVRLLRPKKNAPGFEGVLLADVLKEMKKKVNKEK